jgi:hypothetical protein
LRSFHWSPLIRLHGTINVLVEGPPRTHTIRRSTIGKELALHRTPGVGQRSAIIYSLVVLCPAPRQRSAPLSARCAHAAACDDQPQRSHSAYVAVMAQTECFSIKVAFVISSSERPWSRFLRTSLQTFISDEWHPRPFESEPCAVDKTDLLSEIR